MPAPGDMRFTDSQHVIYMKQQLLLQQAIQQEGLRMGVSMVLSGLTRELRRHLPIDQVQEAMRELARTMPDVARYDSKDPAS